MTVNQSADKSRLRAKPGLLWQLLGLIAAAAVTWAGRAPAADRPAQSPEPAESREQNVPNLAEQVPYPRITVSTCYQVDPHWPKRPEGMVWGQTPGVFVDRQDRVWVYTRAVPPVQVYDAKSGKLLFTWDEKVFGKYLDTMLAHQIKIDHRDHVWLADVGNHAIFELDPKGKILRILGTPGEPGCDESHLNKPTDMVVSPQGDVFISDGYGNARVVHFDARGRFVEAWGELGVEPGQFNLPHAIAMDSQGRLYVADRNNARIQVFNTSGKLLSVWQDLIVPWGFCMLPGDRLWVCGCSPMAWRETDEVLSCPPKDQVFMRFDPAGRVQQLWTVPLGETGQEQPGELNWLHGIGVDSQGNIYAVDIHGKRVQKFVHQRPGRKVPFVPKAEEEREMHVALPEAGEAQSLTSPPIPLTVNIDEEGRYYVKNKLLSIDQLQRELDAASVNHPGRVSVVIRADRGCPWKFVAAAMAACNRAKIRDHTTMVLPPEQ